MSDCRFGVSPVNYPDSEEDGKGEDSDDPWRLLLEETFERCQSDFDERVTKHMTRQGVDEDDARKRL